MVVLRRANAFVDMGGVTFAFGCIPIDKVGRYLCGIEGLKEARRQ